VRRKRDWGGGGGDLIAQEEGMHLLGIPRGITILLIGATRNRTKLGGGRGGGLAFLYMRAIK